MAAKKTTTTMQAMRRVLVLSVLAALGIAGWNWLQDHPEHNPMAPLDLRDPIGLATTTKLVALRDDVDQCRAVLERSDVAFTALPEVGEGACARPDRTQLTQLPLSPGNPATTCPVAAALELWRTRTVEPAAREIFGSDVARFEHLGVYNCRRIRGSSDRWSQHATGNAIDISAVVLEDGRRISLIADWDGDADEARFLREIRDGACDVFAVVLSPDYNAAHADHFHFDQTGNFMGVCR
ncbi:extensin family protein [Erythrobacter sp. SCSIO 43205]|uniref:extensin-like domain-containing protein n=1 Tax=Erythrobacter sp. SCSIO 43205 TaxID=2779361 RepID=UPI001CAA2033|nr:extensin family protein [Erythrobacter sp. SCSIO 43205]UAB77040.1 extensin family protein [Erythrobacter sp. SCSIO 43205]